MVEFRDVPAKLLLFGEFSVLQGSSALTLPLYDYSAKLLLPSDKDEPNTFSNTHIKNFWQFLKTQHFEAFIDLEKLQHYLNQGLYLKSNIPQGYGLGSSASLCVAILKAFGTSEINKTEELRAIYSEMESFFHGKSSGIDPLAIHLESPLLIRNGDIEFLDKTKLGFFQDINIYLLDTGISRNSSQMISGFKESMENVAYYNSFTSRYLPMLEKIIDSIVHNKTNEWEKLLSFSRMQLACFRKMIPDSLIKIWMEGLENKDFCLKLLGAGGGGFFLIFSKVVLSESELGWKLKKLSL
jgi:mevalonate kinase